MEIDIDIGEIEVEYCTKCNTVRAKGNRRYDCLQQEHNIERVYLEDLLTAIARKLVITKEDLR